MKKALSKTIIIVACVVAVLAVAILVLCLVSLDPVKTLDGYDRVEVYNLSSSDRIEITADKADQKAKLDEAIDKTSFSVMQGILEGKASVSYKFKTEVKEGETKESRVEIAAEDIASVAATDTLYKLVFVFSEAKTVTVEGEELTYDRAIVLVGNSNNEIGTLEIVFYLDSRVGNEAEDEEKSLKDRYRYDYCIPDSASNLWFDGWVLMKDAEEVEAATMFVNFLSMPENVIRNMYYIGYTSCIAGEEVFDYVQDTYGAEKDAADTAEYDLSYFFGDGYKLTADKEQLTRQLFAQYPDEETLKRCVVMQYFDNDANTRAYKMYNNVTAS